MVAASYNKNYQSMSCDFPLFLVTLWKSNFYGYEEGSLCAMLFDMCLLFGFCADL